MFAKTFLWKEKSRLLFAVKLIMFCSVCNRGQWRAEWGPYTHYPPREQQSRCFSTLHAFELTYEPCYEMADGGSMAHTHDFSRRHPFCHISHSFSNNFLKSRPLLSKKPCRDWFQFRVIIIDNDNTNCSSPILVILQRRSNPLNLFTKMKNPVSEKLLFVYCVSVCVLFTHAQDVNVEVSAAANEKTAAVEDTNSHINVQERKFNFEIYCSPFSCNLRNGILRLSEGVMRKIGLLVYGSMRKNIPKVKWASCRVFGKVV